ncbi:MAG: hypothetical protein DRN66_03520 [Candidatus Nanohalarchaeota archaeon]|nr:MAG: hypothetical protein DRN66_03520 [Candidatus Nanohaloarchaeota archaeon]
MEFDDKAKKELENKILETGQKLNDRDLLNAFLENYEEIIEDMKRTSIKFRDSNIGVVPNYRLPGLETKKIFLEKLKKKQTNIIKGEVTKFLIIA